MTDAKSPGNLPGRLLLVDDEERNRMALRDSLVEHGHDVVVTSTGAGALALLREQPFDLVLLDEALPDTDGYAVLREIRADAGLGSIPVIMVSAQADSEEAVRGIELGADDYLRRPYNEVLLRTRVAALIERQRLISFKRQHLQEERLMRYESELEVARQIQAGFLPPSVPQFPGWEIAARFDPAREVAGDFYDVFTISNNRRVALIVADVCDKGVHAALFMALGRSLLRAFAQQHHSAKLVDVMAGIEPHEQPPTRDGRARSATGTTALTSAVELTNEYITSVHGDSNMFFTLFFGLLDPATGVLAYINAGHNPPMLCTPQGIKARLKPGGPAVGIMRDASFTIQYADFAPGDTLLAFTDGVTDAHDPKNKLFSDQRLAALLTPPPDSAVGTLDLVEQQVRRHIGTAKQFDDITMLAVRRAPAAG